MLLFNVFPPMFPVRVPLFQYILCCCLTQTSKSYVLEALVSIHLMLLFNCIYRRLEGRTGRMFQYILCCCLTAIANDPALYMLPFQYILCCCLTFLSHLCHLPLSLFQYIFCCCLTKVVKPASSGIT